MSKDLKDLIDTVEKETHSQAQLEQIISSLKEEINRLKFTVKEQKLLIENLKSQVKDEQIERGELPSEIGILKDIISSQRLELKEKQSDIEKLNDQIDKLTASMETNGDIGQLEIDNKKYLEAQTQIVQLSEENQEYRSQIKFLQNQIEEIQLEKSETEELIEEEGKEPEVNEELINFKRLNFQLMEENGLLRLELESLKAKFQKRLEEAISEELESINERNSLLSAELELANDKIGVLTAELEGYKAQIKYLDAQLKDNNEPVIVSEEDALEFAEMRDKFDNLKIEVSKYQKENQRLNEMIEQLTEKKARIDNEKVQEPKILQSIPKQLQLSLFNRIYHLLDKDNKETVINLLIQDLKSNNNEIKRNAIKILSHIRYKKVYDALFELISDKDWIVRYNIIKALSKFEKKSEKFVSFLKNLSRDADVDVRELAIKVLNDISEANSL